MSRSKVMWLLFVAIGAVLGAVILAARSSPPDPVYKGRPLSVWLEDWWPAHSAATGGNLVAVLASRRKQLAAQEAVQALGTNAIPYLLRNARRNDSGLRIIFQRSVPLRSLAARLGMTKYLEPNWRKNVIAAQALRFIGPQTKPFIADLTDVLEHHPSPDVRSEMAKCIGTIGPAAAGAVPVLTRAAIVGPAELHPAARSALLTIGDARTNGFPIVAQYLRSTNATVQTAALVALDVVDPEGVISNHGLRHRAALATGADPQP